MTIPNVDLASKQRWIHLRRILERSGPFKDPNFEPSAEVRNIISIRYCTSMKNFV